MTIRPVDISHACQLTHPSGVSIVDDTKNVQQIAHSNIPGPSMDTIERIETSLDAAILRGESEDCPPRLCAAVRHAVFPAGARIRPRLCVAVATACGHPAHPMVDATAAAIELLHCASLVHDDLPCFDDAPTRRGRPSVHRAFGEATAVLAGDALIVMAFQVLAAAGTESPHRLAAIIPLVAGSVGLPHGIVCGQAWECEPRVARDRYHRQKTGALFAAAAMAGAEAAGCAGRDWRPLGDNLGEAFQVADDLHDVVTDARALGKPVGRDAALGRPSAVAEFGIVGAVRLFERLIATAIDSIPACPGADLLARILRKESERILPVEAARMAA